jgi:hypothetical protein
MTTLNEMLQSEQTRLADVTEHLRKLPHDKRVEQSVELCKKSQVRLWDLAAGASEAVTLDYLVPKGAKLLEPFPFEGRNSLPMFTRFQKVFYRMPDGLLGGYNNQKVYWITGWGYYVAEPSAKSAKEVAVNYMKLPGEKPEGWPEIKSNTAGLSRFVYGNTIDFLRWVSEDVVIGRATKRGEIDMPNWFVLCRKIPLK